MENFYLKSTVVAFILIAGVASHAENECSFYQRKQIYHEATYDSTEYSKDVKTKELAKIVGPSLIEERFGATCYFLGEMPDSSTVISKFVVIPSNGKHYSVILGYDEEAGYVNHFEIRESN